MVLIPDVIEVVGVPGFADGAVVVVFVGPGECLNVAMVTIWLFFSCASLICLWKSICICWFLMVRFFSYVPRTKALV